jgi:tetratricopeptide (TPR) repeat protein
VRTGRIIDGTNLLERAIQQTASKRNSGQAFRVAWLAEAYLKAGRIGEAYDRAQLALEFARNHEEKGREAWILRLIAMIHDRQKQDGELVESYYRQALVMATQLGMRPLQAHCHFGLGEFLKRANEQKKAVAELCFAIELFGSMDMIAPLTRAKNCLADLALANP